MNPSQGDKNTPKKGCLPPLKEGRVHAHARGEVRPWVARMGSLARIFNLRADPEGRLPWIMERVDRER